MTPLIQRPPLPLLLVVMGVSGTGKTTLACEIARHFDIPFLDADTLHSKQAIKHMSLGIPLTDELRAPWIQRICNNLRQFKAQNQSCVLAYSGLKQQHRDLVFGSYHHTLGILLNADEELIAQRLESRSHHFMSPCLLSSQIASMEPLSETMTQFTLSLNAGENLQALLLRAVYFINQDHDYKL